MVEQKIKSLLDEKFKEEEWRDCFLVELELNNSKLRVFIDSDTGVTFEKCQKISRYLESYLDSERWLGEHYILEVSSPGIDRPLKYLRQYHRNIGRNAEVTLMEGEKRTGRLLEVNGEAIFLEEKQRIKEGKKKKTKIIKSKIPFDQIKQTKIKISFS